VGGGATHPKCDNSIRSEVERGLSLSTEMVEFGGFLEDLEHESLPLLGRRFTW
jgi:hypothetical protein